MRLTIGAVCLFLNVASAAIAEWTAPENPSPKRILREAQEDARAGRYETALQKHIWYHRNALRYEPAQRGVRLSFALGDWKRLGEQFPPAKLEFEAEHAEAKRVLDAKPDDPDAIVDWTAFNRTIGDTKANSDLFLRIAARNPEVARQVYRPLESSLVSQKQYTACGPYLNPDWNYDRAFDSLQRARTRPARLGIPDLSSLEERFFARQVATLVGLLAVNGRRDDAEKYAERGKAELKGNNEATALINQALEGKLPESSR